jgi:tRNA 2-thiouridine synthesizing protein C
MKKDTCDGSVFFSMEPLSAERLGWMVEVLKYYCTRLHPESLHHKPYIDTPPFYFFISGDACHSLVDRRTLPFWEVFFRLSPVRCVCDQKELKLRGHSVEALRMKNPESIVVAHPLEKDSDDSFWEKYFEIVSVQGSTPRSAGVLHLQSPYMYLSAVILSELYRAAISHAISPEFYAFLDGVHALHQNQNPSESENIGRFLELAHNTARRAGLDPLYLACSRSATARGYSTFCGENGKIISGCTIPELKIRDLHDIVERFSHAHPILSHTSFFIRFIKYRRYPDLGMPDKDDTPPVLLFITRTPYGMEMTFGALSFALVCAHENILTRVVFIEDGVYALTGNHEIPENENTFNLQHLIKATSHIASLEYYVYTPSLQQRGLFSGTFPDGICSISHAELAHIIFSIPSGSSAGFQRGFIF